MTETDAKLERLMGIAHDDVEDLNLIVPQMSSSAVPLTEIDLYEMLNSPTRVYVARVNGHIIGVALMVVVRQLVGIKCWVEDVVVDVEYRGQGIAERLLRMAIDELPEGTKSVNLTSKPARDKAHRLYERLGFVQRETDVYRLTL